MNKRPIRKKAKKKKPPAFYAVISIGIVFVLFAIVSIILTEREESQNADANKVTLYFYDMNTASLKSEQRTVNYTEHTEIVKYVLEELVLGPKTVSYKSSVPSGIIESAVIIGTNVDVSVSENYPLLNIDEEIICRSSIAASLTALDFVETVTINVNGEEFKKPSGQPLGKIKASDIVLLPDTNPKGESLKTLVLYFADASGTGLVKENRNVLINPNESMAKYIVTELINGPASDNLTATVPPETKLLDISSSDGVCYVDLSKEFVSKHQGGETAELLTIYSIVNSLAEESDIKNVQFLIDGERQEQFKGNVDFRILFEAKEMPPAVQ